MLRQVNTLIRSRDVVRCLSRCNYSERGSSPGKVLHPLESRRLLKVLGDEAALFLQGLITNDMRHFEEGSKSIYAMFLNNKGRVLYDSLIHRWEDNTFLIECDCKTIGLIAKHLKLYKLKRNIKVEDVSTSYSLWALIAPKIASADLEIDPSRKVNIYKDPRLTDLGYRVISALPLKGSDVSAALGRDVSVEINENQYRYLRYKLGVSEGSGDLSPGVSFPLEANCDYLHGVSFHKGCYIGQELTARIHHTGVVRKRIMPLKFIGQVKEDLANESVISATNNPKISLGKLKGYIFDRGLGLMRIKETLEAKTLTMCNISIEAVKPSWWPIEAPKEKLNIKSE